MTRRPIFAALVAAAFAFPLAAGASDMGGKSSKMNAGSANDGGAEAMFTALDKNGDGFLSKEEVKGTPHEAEFALIDKNGDGKISREEHFMAKEHVAARAKANGTAASASSSGSMAGSTSDSSSKPSSGTKY